MKCDKFVENHCPKWIIKSYRNRICRKSLSFWTIKSYKIRLNLERERDFGFKKKESIKILKIKWIYTFYLNEIA